MFIDLTDEQKSLRKEIEDYFERVAERLRGYEFVEEVRYGREWVDKVYALRRIAGGAALAA